MTRLAIDDRNLKLAAEMRAKIDQIQTILTRSRADVANAKEREVESREKANQMADASRKPGRTQ